MLIAWRTEIDFDYGDIVDIGSRLDDLAGHWAVWVDENWRLTFAFEGRDVILVDYRDYH